MPDTEGFLPPVAFNPAWVLLGLALLAVVAAWLIIVPALTRARAVPDTDFRWEATAPMLAERYVALIDDVAAAHERFELTGREAHQRLSALVRGFAHESSGYPASAMTLSELRQLDLPRLTGAVEHFYPAEFGRADRGSVPAAVSEARRVVLEWGAGR